MAKATVTITAKDQMSQGLNQAKKSAMQFQQNMDKLGSALSKAFKVTSVTAGIIAVGKAMSDCVKEFSEADKVARRMTTVWDNVGKATGKSARQIDDYAEAIEKSTFFSSEAIKESALLLAATESLTDEGFDRAMQVSLDLAAAMGENVTAAAQTLAKAIQEPESALSRLKTIGVSFTDDEKKQIKELAEANKQFEAQEMILAKVESKYKGVAQAIADTPMGKLDAIKDTLGDIRENIGKDIVDALDPAFTFILRMLQRISDWAKNHMDQKEFWKAADTGNSHKLYSSYTESFLTDRQAESMQMLAEQMQIMRTNPWGSLLEEKYGKSLEEILTYNSVRVMDVAIKAAIEKYGPNYADTIGTVEGFSEIFNDQYQPLMSQLKTINSALEEYVQARTIDRPEFGSSGLLPKTLTNFLEKNGKASTQYQIEGYQKIIQEAENYRTELFDQLKNLIGSSGTFGANGRLPNQDSIDEVGRNIAVLNDIIDANNQAIEKLANPAAEMSELEKVLTQYGKTSSEYQVKQISAEIEKVMALYDGATAEQETYLNQILGNLIEQRYAIEHPEETGGNNIEGVFKSLGPIVANLEQMDSFEMGVFNSFADNLGKAGDVASSLASNMSLMGPELGAIMTVLDPIIQGLGEQLAPALNVIMDTVLQPLIEIGKAIGSLLVPVFELLTPVLQLFGKAVVVVASVFQWVGDTLHHWVASFVNAFTWLTGYHMQDNGSPGNIIDYVNNKVTAYTALTNGSDNATQTAISSASYRGATSVTINLYQQAPVVGDNGMRQFAAMIRDEFEAMDYYGVTT